MNPRRTLVVFFSRTGTTRAVAQNLSSALKSDIEEIKEKRSGTLNSLRFRFDVKRGKCAPIEALEKIHRHTNL